MYAMYQKLYAPILSFAVGFLLAVYLCNLRSHQAHFVRSHVTLHHSPALTTVVKLADTSDDVLFQFRESYIARLHAAHGPLKAWVEPDEIYDLASVQVELDRRGQSQIPGPRKSPRTSPQ